MNERIVYALCELIGRTPLVRLGRFGEDLPGQFGSPSPSDRPGDLARRWRRGRPPVPTNNSVFVCCQGVASFALRPASD